MPTQKWCSVAGCKNFIFASLNDFEEHGWKGFQMGKGKVKCYCPKHKDKCIKDMKKALKEKE